MTLKTKATDIQLKGLDHFALNVKNMKRSEKFYSKILGFPVIHRTQTQAGLQHIEVDAGNVAIALFESPKLDLKAAHKTMTDDGYLHFAFAAKPKQYEDIAQNLKDHNVEMDGEPKNHPGGKSIYFFDPDGHHLEIHFAD